ncbi:MAG: hypothetical protein CMC95_04805 [Flavobacteriales bacterium]|nr:hypothetical protein [Flavobacteriales bacterium]|tara:strand:+ start:1410 stop:1952 length:543 start_codon:yes stop_codon:yes gene_type:complete
MAEQSQMTLHSSENSTFTTSSHKLHDTWNLWAHLPHDTSWNLESYKKITTFKSVEEIIALNQALPDVLIKNCMLFLMRDGIQPIWEDPKNRSGGCFSYKINIRNVVEVWKNLSYALVGETITLDNGFLATVNGITISPKKNFCIIKIWLSTCGYQDTQNIISIKGLNPHGCIFKKHNPEF